MFNIIPPLLIILGLAGLIFLFREEENSPEEKQEIRLAEEDNWMKKASRWTGKRLRKIFNRGNYQKASNHFFLLIEKSLVRSRIIILRVDRTIFKNLSSLRKRKDDKEDKDEGNGIVSSFEKQSASAENTEENGMFKVRGEEKRLLKQVNESPDNVSALKNLARIYLREEDLVSARWALLQAYRVDEEDNVVQSLLIELYQKKDGKQRPAEIAQR